jgi:hypothetical protein
MKASAPIFAHTEVARCHAPNAEDTMTKKHSGKARRGRPPRTDHPVRVGLMLPGEVRRWLRGQATREGRTQSDVLTSALDFYRRRSERGAS